MKNNGGRGWRNEPGRHALAAKGVETAVDVCKGVKQHNVNAGEIMRVIGDVGPWKVQKHGNCWKHEDSNQFIHLDVSKDGKITVDHILPDVTDYEYGFVVEDCNPDEAVEKTIEWMKENEDFMVDKREKIVEGKVGNVRYESNMKEGIISLADSSARLMVLSSPTPITFKEFAEEGWSDGPVRSLLESGLLELKDKGKTNRYQLTERGKNAYEAIKKLRSEIDKEYEKLFPKLI